ncbi:phosphoribosyltransferase [Devosia nitrariae]|uniref:Phosphoribosyltransferase n=1 Tax=Devosia nitrariae TaxID=2071872 RepID=A0ABQ5W414_9HYPH|nr:phosphoribosyltransferase family protein [Devosia nitrariae]GLQ54804.1 phosphoribosyltransferase [Devosia nitrariae]
MFTDRREAGRLLAQHLEEFSGKDSVVLALPRGGVPVAAEICAAIGAPLGLLPVRKIGLPGQSELAVGAIARHNKEARDINADILAATGLGEDEIKTLTERARQELEVRTRKLLPDGAALLDPKGKTAILVDDGIATGATMRAAIEAMRLEGAREVIVAVPVGAPDVVADMAKRVDKIVCPSQPRPFRSVGEHYLQFGQVEDEEVRQTLDQFNRRQQ